ncbi:redoxin domain-containing protein [Radiobacillus kanasensis]|uniref:redoxin domain-containing protein n=1 Tax=Radiobacillus kanasensis TaxID=2844358 RepID=UPI001E454BB8|nr:redoxin domain-containing protein [Radiobacillus kanasensis]UFU01140.1 redoxin domain-containing protein [Radiobacillus kanasensis]
MMKKIIAAACMLGLVLALGVTIWDANQDESKTSSSETMAFPEGEEGAGIVSSNAPEQLEIGENAPDFTLENLQGELTSLSMYEGKIVFLNFWATWCDYCKEEMPIMESIQSEYKGDVHVIAVNALNSELDGVNKVKNYINQGGYTFEVLLDREGSVVNQYRVVGLPTTFVIDKEGKLIETKLGPMTEEYMQGVIEGNL